MCSEIRVSWHHGNEEKRFSWKKKPKRLQRGSCNRVTQEQFCTVRRSHGAARVTQLPNVYSAGGFYRPEGFWTKPRLFLCTSHFSGSSCSLIGWPWPNLGMLVLWKIKLIFSQHNPLLGYAHGLSSTPDMDIAVGMWITFHLMKFLSIIITVSITPSFSAHTWF